MPRDPVHVGSLAAGADDGSLFQGVISAARAAARVFFSRTRLRAAHVCDVVRLLLTLLPVLCLAQAPTVGLVEIYGTRRVPEAEVLKLLGAHEGGRLPKSKADAEERLMQMDRVTAAHVEAACCDDKGQAILYVGLEERGAPHFDYHPEPAAEDVVLPEAVVDAYRSFLDAAREAGRSGSASEDLSQGHSLLSDPKARYLQAGFTGLADEHKVLLRRVIREAADPEQRAMAAYLIGYSKDKASVQNDLQYALRDPDETVRANALRALAAFAVYARRNPDAGLKVSPTWMIEMLNSLVWTDRNNAAVALVTLTESRDPGVLDQIRSRALGSVLEMARWRHLPHALPAFILAGRLAGLTEDALQDAWKSEKREPVIKAAASPAKKK